MNKGARLAAAIITGVSVLMLAGCTSWLYTPGMSELKRLCERDGGDKIYQVVQVDGYFDVNGQLGRTDLTTFIRSGYQYIEYKETEKSFYGTSAMKEPGIWHIYKTDRNNPHCQSHLDEMFGVFKHPKDQDLRDFFGENCLAARNLEKPESRYWYRHETTSRYLDNDQEILFHSFKKSVEDNRDKKILAEGSFYSLLPYRKSSLDYGLTFDCEDVGIQIKTTSFPYRVIPTLNQ